MSLDIRPWILEQQPALSEKSFAKPFAEAGLDSFDLLSLRTHLESRSRRAVPDSAWMKLRTLADLVNFYAKESTEAAAEKTATGSRTQREYLVNMPQMAIGGLSEQWLFKEIGDMHWRLIASGLGAASHDIQDEAGNRLYATFVRIRWSGDQLKAFRENDPLSLSTSLSRHGKSMYFSETAVQTSGKSLHAQLATTFALRKSTNKELLRGEPLLPADCPIPLLEKTPTLSDEYRAVRKGEQKTVELDGLKFSLGGEIYRTTYELNPYADLNGVNLLYFAAYPMIHDICELRAVRELALSPREEVDWSLAAASCARDIFYFANCDLSDRIIFTLECFELLSDGRVKIASRLERESDGQLLARVFAVKTLVGG